MRKNMMKKKRMKIMKMRTIRPRKAMRARSQVRTMLVLFFDWKGVVHMDFQDKGTITSKRYIEILRKFHKSVRRKRPEVWPSRDHQAHQGQPDGHQVPDFFVLL